MLPANGDDNDDQRCKNPGGSKVAMDKLFNRWGSLESKTN
jgi:hypothetical protein